MTSKTSSVCPYFYPETSMFSCLNLSRTSLKSRDKYRDYLFGSGYRGQLSIELLTSFLVLLTFVSILISGILLYSKNSEEFGRRLLATSQIESTARMLDAVSSSGGTIAVSAAQTQNKFSVSGGVVSADLGYGEKVVTAKTFFGNGGSFDGEPV